MAAAADGAGATYLRAEALFEGDAHERLGEVGARHERPALLLVSLPQRRRAAAAVQRGGMLLAAEALQGEAVARLLLRLLRRAAAGGVGHRLLHRLRRRREEDALDGLLAELPLDDLREVDAVAELLQRHAVALAQAALAGVVHEQVAHQRVVVLHHDAQAAAGDVGEAGGCQPAPRHGLPVEVEGVLDVLRREVLADLNQRRLRRQQLLGDAVVGGVDVGHVRHARGRGVRHRVAVVGCGERLSPALDLRRPLVAGLRVDVRHLHPVVDLGVFPVVDRVACSHGGANGESVGPDVFVDFVLGVDELAVLVADVGDDEGLLLERLAHQIELLNTLLNDSGQPLKGLFGLATGDVNVLAVDQHAYDDVCGTHTSISCNIYTEGVGLSTIALESVASDV